VPDFASSSPGCNVNASVVSGNETVTKLKNLDLCTVEGISIADGASRVPGVAANTSLPENTCRIGAEDRWADLLDLYTYSTVMGPIKFTCQSRQPIPVYIV